MIRFSVWASRLRLQSATLSLVVAGFLVFSTASAADLDFNVANGNYTTPGNWVDSTNLIPIATAATPTIVDNAYIRNGGTVTINSNVSSLQMRIGFENVVTNPDYNNNGVVDAADYVLWRKGGPLQNDATPADVGPDDYTYWRARFGGTPLTEEIGKSGTLNWTAGEITGTGSIGGDPYSGGPDIRVGRIRTTNSVIEEVRGTVVQNGATTKLLLPYRQSQLIIGDGSGNGLPTPTSSYTLTNGTIGLAIGNATVGQNDGSTGNSGILVRNGTFTMNGGQIIDVTPSDYLAGPSDTLVAQRFLTVGTASGAGFGSEAVSTANLSGGSINVLGGFRVATANHSRGILNINGPITIVTGGDTSIGYQPNNSGSTRFGVMNMSAGSVQIGRTDIPNQTLTGRFQVGDRGPRDIEHVRWNHFGDQEHSRYEYLLAAAGGSAINMTGGTITTPNLEMHVSAATAGAPLTTVPRSFSMDPVQYSRKVARAAQPVHPSDEMAKRYSKSARARRFSEALEAEPTEVTSKLPRPPIPPPPST